ncbi:cellulose binding domain-containing protein [Micromonospora sp. NPDC051196]|uniref:cellulose binding domain-containing protein n=1 Tax=Micromonospora sp. NPDC051196 TaxID=3155281 RepID=UPI003439DB74
MPVRPVGDESGEQNGRGAVPNVIASAPWVVVLVGVAVLAVLLVVATLSFREPEQPVAWTPGPPMVLPALEHSPTPTASLTSAPASTGTRTASAAPPTASSGPSVLPSRTASASARAEAGPSASTAPDEQPSVSVDVGMLTAGYQVTASDPGSFRAQLVVRNGTGLPVGWVVELRFTSGVTGIRASSGPGVSVSIKGAGWYLLSGVGLLDVGAQQTVRLRVSRTGNGEYPAQCTVNGSACALG